MEVLKPQQVLSRPQLAKKIFEIAHLTGNFKLRSGFTSTEYFDKYRFEARPEVLIQIAEHMKALIPTGTEVLAGLELGGVPIATALSLVTGIPTAFIRKEAKEYGTCQFAEGAEIKNKKICIIEDVITTGGQVILSAEDLKNSGAHILKVLCVIHRGSGHEPKLEKSGLSMQALFTQAELTQAELTQK